jgi:hypothetical protein
MHGGMSYALVRYVWATVYLLGTHAMNEQSDPYRSVASQKKLGGSWDGRRTISRRVT